MAFSVGALPSTSLLPLLVLVLSLFLPAPKATTITLVAASFAFTTYNQEVLFSSAIIGRHNCALLPWLATSLTSYCDRNLGQRSQKVGSVNESWLIDTCVVCVGIRNRLSPLKLRLVLVLKVWRKLQNITVRNGAPWQVDLAR